MAADEHPIFDAEAYGREHDAPIEVEAVLAELPKEVQEKVAEALTKLEGVVETVDLYRKDGDYDDARAERHAAIVAAVLSAEMIEAAVPEEGPPVFMMLGGRGGSGKSWFRGNVYDPAKFIVIDPDDVKARLPEYEGWNAFQVHEESSDIVDAMLTLARALRLNVVLDVTMKSEGSALAKVAVFKRDGYEVEAHYMHLPRRLAAKRALERFAGPNGRFVPPQVVLGNVDNERTFDRVKALADRWSFWTNDVPKGSQPQLVAQGGGARP